MTDIQTSNFAISQSTKPLEMNDASKIFTVDKASSLRWPSLKVLIFQLLYVSRPPNTVLMVANCTDQTIILKQSDFEGYAKKILGQFEHILPKIRDIEKVFSLIDHLRLLYILIYMQRT